MTRSLLAPADLAARIPYLSRDAQGSLLVNERRATDLLATFGSPLMVYLPHRVADNVDSIARAFGTHFDHVSVHYALKACYLSACVSAARSAGASVEVMSGVELQIARQHGFAGDQIICHGLGRDAAYVQAEVDLPGALHVIDSEADLWAIAAAADRRGTSVEIGLRVTPDLGALVDLIPADSKLGFSWSDGQFLRMLSTARQLPGLRIRALHAHGFAHARSPAEWALFVRGVADVARQLLQRHGVAFDVLDIGGGFDTRAVIESHGVTIQDFADVTAAELAPLGYPFRLAVEPGRYVVSDAAVGLGRVVARKDRGAFRWDIVDLASNTLIPIPGASYPPIVVEAGRLAVSMAGIGDGTCAPSVLHEPTLLGALPIGAPIALLAVGAYTSVFAHVWGPLPPTTIALDRLGGTEVLISPQALTDAMARVYGYRLDLAAGR